MFTEDLDAFMDVDEHADHFVIQKNGKVFSGILNNEYVETNDISGTEPVITCKTIDVSGLERGDIIEKGKDLYTFILERADGTGVSELVLNK